MRPKILISYGNKEFCASGGCDGDCACSSRIIMQNFLVEYNGKPDFSLHSRTNQCCDGGCDCACALPSTSTSILESEERLLINLCQVEQMTLRHLAKDSWLLTAPGTLAGWAVVNAPARQVFEFFASPHAPGEWPSNAEISVDEFRRAAGLFYQAGFLTETQPSVSPLTTMPFQVPLEAWLFLTRACNLACAHCFVSKDPHQMTLKTGLQAVGRLFALAQRHEHPGVKIKYAGGEPTLRWNLVTALHERALALSQQSGLPLTEILVTNGAALSRPRLDYLKSANIQIALSLDGFGEGHDRQRPFANGQPSFARIFRSLEMALEMGINPYLTITLTRLNLDDLPALTEFSLQHRLFLNWNFYRPHTLNDPLTAGESDLIAALRKGLAVIEHNLPDYPFLDKLLDRSNFGAAHEHTCGAGRNYLSIDYDGSVLPCHMLSGANQAGVPLKTLQQVRFDQFPNPAVDEKEGCNTCEWRYWCAGGCPVLAGISNGHSTSQSPYCKVYKTIYPELIRLKGLQLLALNAQ